MKKIIKYTLGACVAAILCNTAIAKLPPAAQVYTTQSPLGGGAPLRGMGLGGYGGTEKPDYHGFPYADETEPFLYKGFNTFRLQVIWEELANGQHNYLMDKSHDNYFYKYVEDFITNETKVQKVHIIFDLHNYFRYDADGGDDGASNDKQVLGEPGEPKRSDYLAFWQDVYNTFSKIEKQNHNPDSVIFELMNEPYFVNDDDDPILEQRLADFYFAVIDQIHKEDPNRIFMVDGDEWAGMGRFQKDNPGGPIAYLMDEINKKYGKDSPEAQSIREHIIIDVHDYFFKKEVDNDYGKYGCSDSVDYIRKQEQAVVDFCNAPDHKGVTWLMGEVKVPDYAQEEFRPQCKKDIEAALQYAHTNEPTYSGFTLQASGHSWGADFAGNFTPGTCEYTGENKNISYLPSDTLFDKKSYMNEVQNGTSILHDLPAKLWPTMRSFPVKYIINNKSDYTLNLDSDSGAIVEDGDNGAGIMTRNWLIPYCNHVEPEKGTISMRDNKFGFSVKGDYFSLNDDGTKSGSGKEIQFNIGKPQLIDDMGDHAIVVNITNGKGHHPTPPQNLPDIPNTPYAPEPGPAPGPGPGPGPAPKPGPSKELLSGSVNLDISGLPESTDAKSLIKITNTDTSPGVVVDAANCKQVTDLALGGYKYDCPIKYYKGDTITFSFGNESDPSYVYTPNNSSVVVDADKDNGELNPSSITVNYTKTIKPTPKPTPEGVKVTCDDGSTITMKYEDDGIPAGKQPGYDGYLQADIVSVKSKDGKTIWSMNADDDHFASDSDWSITVATPPKAVNLNSYNLEQSGNTFSAKKGLTKYFRDITFRSLVKKTPINDIADIKYTCKIG